MFENNQSAQFFSYSVLRHLLCHTFAFMVQPNLKVTRNSSFYKAVHMVTFSVRVKHMVLERREESSGTIFMEHFQRQPTTVIVVDSWQFHHGQSYSMVPTSIFLLQMSSFVTALLY
jgi:hypothetical protein